VQSLAKEVAVSKEWKKLSDAATALADKYPATFYATEVQLMAAKAAFDAKQYAEASKHLQWVIDKGRKSHVNVARIRLASIQLDEKKYDDALKTLDAVKEEGFVSLAADLRGDVYAAQGKRDEARAAYELATNKADERSPLKGISQAKLDAFGGATPKADAKAGDDKSASKPAESKK
jgi:predicted negative regulator of RcsB-dependent stress response